MLSVKLFSRRTPGLKVILYREIHRNYYDALGLTPKATQADIKKAYYNMSMVFHPDKEEGNALKFREITTAYEVLGNNKLRKLYDQGLLPVGASAFAAAKESQSKPESAEPPEFRHRKFDEKMRTDDFDRKKEPYTGKTEHFDFDAWTKAHYAETFARRSTKKAQFTRDEEKKARLRLQKLQKYDMLVTAAFAAFVLGIIHYIGGSMKHDFPSPVRNEK